MAPTYIKGGVWTNVEDEILRAAISKYGLNQWARVSSLLARKTAKQVKARWFEWLDPTIKKIEWSRDEDEKLLHLAKLMPTQWRTIAPIVGRTATQCIERYQKLLDAAEKQDEGAVSTDLSLTGVGADAAPASNAPKYRVGEIDPTPESKPARPDAIDMDEDEKEMLSEARARLANTQGKKAKRKDRERILEESRRLAVLQKRRELKLAGINTKLTKKRKGQTDYNADIPFEHKPAAGFYDTSEEQEANLRRKNAFDLRTHHNGMLMKESVDKDKKDKKRNRDPEAAAAAAEQSAQAKAERLLALNQEDKIAKRRKLVLPAPQVTEDELEQIVKHGSRGDKTREQYGADESVTGTLVGDYKDTTALGGGAETFRTPQVPMGQDKILQSVRDIHALSNEQSSLLGQSNTPLHDASFSSRTALPTRTALQTPNPLALQGGSAGHNNLQTPRRDGLGVNRVGVEATPREALRRRFASLPKPLNNFDIVIPEEEQVEGAEAATTAGPQLPEDAGERARADQKEAELAHQRELQRRSQVLQKGLPRPTLGNGFKKQVLVDFKDSSEQQQFAEINEQIAAEFSKLIVSDNNRYPIDPLSQQPVLHDTVDPLDDETKASVLRAISEEVDEARLADLQTQFASALESRPQFLPGLSSYDSDAEEEDDDSDGTVSAQLVSQLTSISEQSNKLEKKLIVTMGGYTKRQALLTKKLGEAFSSLTSLQKDRLLYEDLRQMEEVAISARLNELQEEVNFLADAERKGQERYRALQDELL